MVCINNTGYPASLEIGKLYRTRADAEAARDGMVRVIDESGDDYLYTAEWFEPISVPRRAARILGHQAPRTKRRGSSARLLPAKGMSLGELAHQLKKVASGNRRNPRRARV